MICKSCCKERLIEDFPFRHNEQIRQKVCRICMANRTKACQAEKKLKDEDLRLQSMKNIILDIGIACETKNGKSLKLCIEKAKVEIKFKTDKVNLKNAKNALKEMIEACETRNGRRLKICLEKSKTEMAGMGWNL